MLAMLFSRSQSSTSEQHATLFSKECGVFIKPALTDYYTSDRLKTKSAVAPENQLSTTWVAYYIELTSDAGDLALTYDLFS